MKNDQTNPLTEPPVAELAELSYEQARDELVDVVSLLERGGLDLDASLQLWERGEALATRCEEHLAGARVRIDSLLTVPKESDEPEEPEDN